MSPIINIKRGDAPVASSVIERAKIAYMTAQGWPEPQRSDAILEGQFRMAGYLQDAPKFDRAMRDLSQFDADLVETYAVNAFNAALVEYKAAVARLGRHPLATGQAEITGERETGEVGEDGQPVTETVLVASAIEPLPAQIEIDVRDPETFEITGTELIDNPAIVQDEAERRQAQAVIDRTPPDVATFAG